MSTTPPRALIRTCFKAATLLIQN
ncbi:hypothetical protein E2C01_081354 [Portunus trituberculatus]|uniref:Uncharacterized protein n=1 Tax=Portunus trituberculatus TaxID=210409 RepID=A0A5B7J234_PORTR|nr:hypothetical protein [Portunus trituberculatus]